MNQAKAFETLVMEAVASACVADAEHRVGALAAIVRRGMDGDDAVISAMRLAERAVHELEPIELRLLIYIASGPPVATTENDVLVPVTGGVDINQIREALHGHRGTHESIVAQLTAGGLIEDCAIGSVDYKGRSIVTEFGLEVLVFLQSYEGESRR